jgi:hydroxymethylbilane synthase
VVAYAALARLGEVEAVTEMLAEEVMLPAPGQGALAVQCRGGAEFLSLLNSINDTGTEIETRAERAFLAALGGGCAVPVAARCRVDADGRMWIKGRVCSPDGSRRIDVAHYTTIAELAEGPRLAEEAGKALAAAAMEKGAGEILGTVTFDGGAPR